MPRSASAVGRAGGDQSDGERADQRDGLGGGLPVVSVCGGEDRDGADGPEHEPRLDDRVRPRQQPPDRRGGRRAVPVHRDGRRADRRADRQGRSCRRRCPRARCSSRARCRCHRRRPSGTELEPGLRPPPVPPGTLRSRGPGRRSEQGQLPLRAFCHGRLAAGRAICVATQILKAPAEEEVRSAVGMLKLLGDETRLRVIWALLEGEHSVNELAERGGRAARCRLAAPRQAASGPPRPQPPGGHADLLRRRRRARAPTGGGGVEPRRPRGQRWVRGTPVTPATRTPRGTPGTFGGHRPSRAAVGARPAARLHGVRGRGGDLRRLLGAAGRRGPHAHRRRRHRRLARSRSAWRRGPRPRSTPTA